MYRLLFVSALLSGFAFSGGCSNKPPPLRPPKYKPSAVAQAAIQQYDRNQDGVIDGTELKDAHGLRFSQQRIDADNNRQLTEDEIAAFVQEKWLDAGAGGIRIKCIVSMNDQPLSDATVTFEPEKFLGGVVGPAEGITMDDGFTPISATDGSVPQGGVRPGLYLVRISKKDGDEETVPAKFNTETTLGVEVARRASYMPGAIEFNLRSR